MKKLLFFIIFIPLVSFSQEGFEFIYEDSTSTACTSSFVDSENYIISLGSSRNTNTGIYDALILKYQNTSDIIVKKFNPDGAHYAFHFGYQKENGNYLLIGLTGLDMYPIESLYFLEVTPELEQVQENYYTVPGGYPKVNIQDILKDDDNTVIISGVLYNDFYQKLGIFVARINENGEVLKTTISTECKSDVGTELIKKKDGNGYLLLGTYQYNLVSFDNDLNIVEYLYYPVGQAFNTPVGMRRLPDGNIMIVNMANQSVPGAYYDIRVRKVDNDFYTLKDTTFFDEGKNRVPPYSGLDYVDPDNIWVVSFHQTWKSSKDEWERARVYIVDSDLNVKGAKYFAGDLDVALLSTKATEDGGCIITGYVPKDGKSYDWNIYIRKLVLDDIYTSSEETPAPDDSDVLLFPNPVKDVLNVETYRKGLSLSLFDENGRNVISRKSLNVPHTSFDIQQLKSGIYLYSVFYENKVIETGKIIKK